MVYELGKSTENRPIIMAVISSRDNIDNIDYYKEILKKLSEPENINDTEARDLAKNGKLFVMIGCSIHASEIGASQMSMELAYRLARDNTNNINDILDNVVLLLVPSLNPDGLDIVVDWYNKNLNTPYEGSMLPWLYHKYVGHDINRDYFMFHLKETQVISRALYKDWLPQIFLSMHQMGSYGARLFIPPHYDPPNPNIDPILIRETSLLGLSIAAYLDSDGKKGVLTNALFPEWYPGYEDSAPMMHNIICLLSEAASVNIASPVFIKPSELRGGGRGFEKYQKQINFPNPWEGGWWKLRDIVDYELSTCMAILKTGAIQKQKFLENFYRMGKNAIIDGNTKPPYAFIIPENQNDINTLVEMINILIKGGIKVNRAEEEFEVNNTKYPEGTYIIYLSQPYRSYIKTLLERQKYPERVLYKGGPPEVPYDLSGWTLPLQMGIKTIKVDFKFNVKSKIIKKAEPVNIPVVPETNYGFLLNTEINDTYKVINYLLKNGCDISRFLKPLKVQNKVLPPGTFLVLNKANTKKILTEILNKTPVPVYSIESKPDLPLLHLNKPEIGIYAQWGGNIDEGWTRLLLEKYGFDFNIIRNNFPRKK